MSREGAPRPAVIDGSALRVGIVAASWYAELGEALVAGASRTLAAAGVREPVLLRVPGSFELPLAVQALAGSGCDAVVALGIIVRGGTSHFEHVCRAVTDGLTRVALDTGVPVGFGVLTCDDVQQARDRVGLPGSSEDKGGEAAQAAVVTALTLRRLVR